jgi:hypothetical protein
LANPNIIAVPAGAWLKVATNVLTGFIHTMKRGVMYQQTYRLTGAAAPTVDDPSEGAEMPWPGAPISALAGIDVYIYCTSGDGKIRVDV